MPDLRQCALVLSAALTTLQLSTSVSAPAIPATPREYRATWCATVDRIDWPSVAGVSSSNIATQKQHLISHLDAMVDMKMNCMYLQVRPACDAFYDSSLEPWSRWLTGSQLTDATYDPLTFAVEEAHKRGIELHAWVNPYRASTDQVLSTKSPLHVMKSKPELCVYHTDGRVYLDPGKEGTIDHIKNVIAEIVTNYDVDGVVFDDYFYPGQAFDDTATYNAYVNDGGTMTIHNWRRNNVDRLIQQCYSMIHGIRQSCQFEVGPFGIWKPGYPSGVSGADYYSTHYCDTRKWLQSGWVDSLSPQLYWPLDSPGQPFGALIDWWVAQNPNRHVLASTAPYRIGNATYANWGDETAQEIVDQVNRTYQAGGVGNVHFSQRWLTNDSSGVRTALKAGPYAKDALRPASTWLDNIAPPPPTATMKPTPGQPSNLTITFSQAPTDEKAVWWCVNTWNGSQWNLKVLPGISTSYTVAGPVTEFAVSAVDRNGNESAKVVRSAVADWGLY